MPQSKAKFVKRVDQCWIQCIMHTEIWGVSEEATWELSSITTGTLIWFSEILFPFIVLVLIYGFSILIYLFIYFLRTKC